VLPVSDPKYASVHQRSEAEHFNQVKKNFLLALSGLARLESSLPFSSIHKGQQRETTMPMTHSKCVYTTCLSLFLIGSASFAQDPAPAAAPAAPAPNALIEIGGLIDGYYSFNSNHPASRNNNLRYFDLKANQLSLSMAKLSFDHTPDPVGFKLELGFGRAMDAFHATEPAGVEVVKHIFQAYGIVKPTNAGGLQFDFGKFVTSAGAEVTETHLNWNYSRSFLYANGPFYHMGARVTKPFGSHFTGGFQLVNGWNNVEDNNSGKTVGFTGAFTSKYVNWFNNYYVGPEKNNTNDGMRHFYDTVIALNPTPKANFLLNFDYGQDNRVGGGSDKFYGVSLAAKFQPTETFAISPRYDWYKDKDGFITLTPQTLQEFTITADYRMKEGFLTRFEYRRDWSNALFFDRGNELASSKSQNTLLVGFVVYFGGIKINP
jgi:hypothetical protein